MKKRIFVSYKRANKDPRISDEGIMHQIRENLESRGYHADWDGKIPDSKDWQEQLNAWIKDGHFFVFLASEYSLDSIHCIDEYNEACKHKKPFLLVMLPPTTHANLYREMGKFQIRTAWTDVEEISSCIESMVESRDAPKLKPESQVGAKPNLERLFEETDILLEKQDIGLLIRLIEGQIVPIYKEWQDTYFEGNVQAFSLAVQANNLKEAKNSLEKAKAYLPNLPNKLPERNRLN